MSTWRPLPSSSLWRRWLPEPLHGPVIFLFWLCASVALLLGGMVFYYFFLSLRYDLDEVAALPRNTIYLDRKGLEIDMASTHGRILAARDDLPDFLVQALIAREDARFYQHHGVDIRGLARASSRNLKDRKFTQGASTLTMQLARNTYEIREKSLHRKFLEIAITLRIEQRYNKEQILTHYLNRIYFGSGAYGIEQAARRYFGKSTRNLSDDECALVVGIIRGPHWFSPLRHPDGALEQRRQTLERMKAIGAIDSDKLEQLNARPLKLAEDTATGAQPSYASKAVERELDAILGKLGIQPGGLQVKTTLDMAWQQRLERELEQTARGIENEPNWQHSEHAEHESQAAPAYLQFAAVSTETKSGEVLAWIGGRDFNHSRYDRSRSKRDLGSAFEPFVAAAAAERGKLVLRGKPVQTGRQIGPAEVERLARRCGISGPYQQSEDLLRGAVAASPVEMSIGLATLGNFGKRPDPYLIREIRDSAGKLIYESKPDLTQALSRNAALDAVSVLVKKHGTRCFTGATASERDAWMLRLGPSGATAIWIGFDEPKAIANERRLKTLLDELVKRLDNR